MLLNIFTRNIYLQDYMRIRMLVLFPSANDSFGVVLSGL